MMQVQQSQVTDTEAGSFYIELYKYDSVAEQWNSLAVSDTVAYAQLAASGALTSSLVQIPTAWTGGTMHVPEPVSGVMGLVGLGLLALKRRKV